MTKATATKTTQSKLIPEYGPNGRIARKKAAARKWGWRRALRLTASKARKAREMNRVASGQ